MALSDDLRKRVVEAVTDGGMSRNAAAKRFGVSIASAVRWLHRFAATGEISPAPTGGDRRSDRIEAHRDYLLGLIRRQPDMTLCSRPVGERDPFEVDPALVERALRGHAATQNALARFIEALSSEPLSPVGGDPAFDLAWRHGGIVYVAEIKSRTAENEEQQMRLGLGQALRYRQMLRRTLEVVKAVLVLEAQPLDFTGASSAHLWTFFCVGCRPLMA